MSSVTVAVLLIVVVFPAVVTAIWQQASGRDVPSGMALSPRPPLVLVLVLVHLVLLSLPVALLVSVVGTAVAGCVRLVVAVVVAVRVVVAAAERIVAVCGQAAIPFAVCRNRVAVGAAVPVERGPLLVPLVAPGLCARKVPLLAVGALVIHEMVAAVKGALAHTTVVLPCALLVRARMPPEMLAPLVLAATRPADVHIALVGVRHRTVAHGWGRRRGRRRRKRRGRVRRSRVHGVLRSLPPASHCLKVIEPPGGAAPPHAHATDTATRFVSPAERERKEKEGKEREREDGKEEGCVSSRTPEVNCRPFSSEASLSLSLFSLSLKRLPL